MFLSFVMCLCLLTSTCRRLAPRERFRSPKLDGEWAKAVSVFETLCWSVCVKSPKDPIKPKSPLSNQIPYSPSKASTIIYFKNMPTVRAILSHPATCFVYNYQRQRQTYTSFFTSSPPEDPSALRLVLVRALSSNPYPSLVLVID